jgi:Fur family zinc uptake transcriptional regulator
MQTNAIERMLDKAQRLCLQRDVRLTPQRLEVLKLMIQQDNAISAYDLLDLLRHSEPKAKPPTIYRALEFLLEQGFIHKIESTNSYILCHHFDHPSHTSALFICDNCNSVTEHHVEGIAHILQTIADTTDFNLKHSVIETHGICNHCR